MDVGNAILVELLLDDEVLELEVVELIKLLLEEELVVVVVVVLLVL